MRANDARLLKKSSSGGIFPVVAQHIIRNGGVVYGAAFDETFELVKHQRVVDLPRLSMLQGSKYIQSATQGVYRAVAHDIGQGRTVLFSGTPCQVDALRLYLDGEDCSRLYLIDLFCYGVPSPKIWRQWLKKLRDSHSGERVTHINFRDKTKGWENYSLRVDFADGTSYVGDKAQDLFLGTFSKGAYIRESCYSCMHKAFPRGSDITLGDFQEIDSIDPAFNRPSGASMVKINTRKGRQLLDELVDEIESNKVEAWVMDAIHPCMGSPVTRDRRRDAMVRYIDAWDVKELLFRYGRDLPNVRMKKTIKSLIKAVLARAEA